MHAITEILVSLHWLVFVIFIVEEWSVREEGLVIGTKQSILVIH